MCRLTSKPKTNTKNSLVDFYMEKQLRKIRINLKLKKKKKNKGFAGGSAGEESACSAGDPSSIPGSGRSSGEGIGYPLQYLGPPWWLRW